MAGKISSSIIVYCIIRKAVQLTDHKAILVSDMATPFGYRQENETCMESEPALGTAVTPSKHIRKRTVIEFERTRTIKAETGFFFD